MAEVSLLNSYCMLKNARVAAFAVSRLVRENQQGVKLRPHPLHPETIVTPLILTDVCMKPLQPLIVFD